MPPTSFFQQGRERRAALFDGEEPDDDATDQSGNPSRRPGTGVKSRIVPIFFISRVWHTDAVALMLPGNSHRSRSVSGYVLLDVGRPMWGLVAGHTLLTIPYVVRTTLAVLHNFDLRLEEAARNLGASPARTFFEVTLPLIKPGVLAGAIFAFIVSFDQFPVSLFLVSPGSETLPIVLFNYLKFDLDGTIGCRLGGVDPARPTRRHRARPNGSACALTSNCNGDSGHDADIATLSAEPSPLPKV